MPAGLCRQSTACSFPVSGECVRTAGVCSRHNVKTEQKGGVFMKKLFAVLLTGLLAVT